MTEAENASGSATAGDVHSLGDVDSCEMSAQFPALPVVDGVRMPWEALLSGPRPAIQPDLWFCCLGRGRWGRCGGTVIWRCP
jgi:hypothetical protein